MNRLKTAINSFECKLCSSKKIFLLHRFSGAALKNFIPRFNKTYKKNFLRELNISDSESFLLVYCSSCEFAFIANPLSPQKLHRLYERVIDPSATKTISQQSEHRNFFLNIWLDILSDARNKKVLDIGCGWGEFLQIGLSLGFDCHGYEFDRGKYSALKKRGIKMVDQLDKVSTKYDFILLNQVLEHVVDPTSLVKSCRNLLKNDGRLLIAVPDFSNMNQVLSKLKRGEETTKTLNPLEHVNYFTSQSLRRLVSGAGFTARDYYPLRFENWGIPTGVAKEIVKMFLDKLVDFNPFFQSTFVSCKIVK